MIYGTPLCSIGGIKRKREADFGPNQGYISETVQDRR